ncbi:uncharacterized protein EV422DRAFT_547883 [Fimicolochytrium jonesii]|uniref:uncharacterized protein n=1 Tax=Fimicolochytrium jonesii TaxID=1396493 RepID=UPI0022FE0AF7|nr:uncharacterized protein EV422DRAFT_547883 [Fimicolochytrium jonesii]KAI8815864.1 hypothetical protein EV422DRAFT_547883 [Fimicolochytrium jonesii]
MSTYPWLLSSLPARRPRPTFWSALKEKHFLALGTARARKHLHHPTYDFPDQFNIDAAAVTQELLTLLGDPRTAGDEDRLRDVMVKQLANRFAAGYRSMQAKGQDVRYTLTGTPRVTVSGLHFHYGPYPPPEGYARQQWWQFIELVIPAEDAQFTSHPRQKEIMKHAEDDGVYFKIDTRVDLDLEFVVVDKTSGMPLIRDRRRRVELQFVSPHFTPWDEVFELDAEGEWLLRWKWRVSDVDWLVESGGDL